jgi:hypothetical protein
MLKYKSNTPLATQPPLLERGEWVIPLHVEGVAGLPDGVAAYHLKTFKLLAK